MREHGEELIAPAHRLLDLLLGALLLRDVAKDADDPDDATGPIAQRQARDEVPFDAAVGVPALLEAVVLRLAGAEHRLVVLVERQRGVLVGHLEGGLADRLARDRRDRAGAAIAPLARMNLPRASLK